MHARKTLKNHFHLQVLDLIDLAAGLPLMSLLQEHLIFQNSAMFSEFHGSVKAT